MITNALNFPAPRYPNYASVATVEDLMPFARKALARTTGRGALGKVKPGQKVILFTPEIPRVQNSVVLEAVINAFREKGIEAETITEVEIGQTETLVETDQISASDGWKEIFWREQITRMLPPEIQIQSPHKALSTMRWNPECLKPLRQFLEKNRQYDCVYVGIGGRDDYRYGLLDEGRRFTDNWIYHTPEDLISRENDFPGDVWDMVEKKTVTPLSLAEEVRITDPQGTEVWWNLSQEEARMWGEVALHTGHLYMFPPAVRGSLCDLAHLRGKVEEVFYFPKAQGIISSTSNHTGFYPHMKALLEDGVLVQIEGGGLYGELLRLVLSKTKDIPYPTHPKPGYYYLTECALGTNPKTFQSLSVFDAYKWFPNIGERNRSGVIHWGFGVHITQPDIVKWAKERHLPHEHGWHMHSLFPTYAIKKRSTGEWIKIIDKGRLTALDDPEVRSLSAGYGDPDEILSEDWIPAIPGINYPGDYLQNYGKDPAGWVKNSLEGRLPHTIGVPI